MAMMKKRPWGLLCDPFCDHSVAAKPFLANEPFQRAYRNLFAAARSARNCLLLTGEPGLGKTMLLRYLVRGLPLAGIVVETFSSELEKNELLPAANATLKKGRADVNVQAAWPAFHTHIVQRAREGRPVVLAVDDADALSDAILLEMLTLRSADHLGVPLTVLIVGSPALAPRLDDIARASGCEIAVQAELSALSESDVAAYVTQALARAGCRGARPFPPITISRLTARSNGILANINMICQRALTLAEDADLDEVPPEMIDRVADGQMLWQSWGETHVVRTATATEPLQEKYGPPEPPGAATVIEYASAKAPGERTGLSDGPIVGVPSIAPGRGLTADALVGGEPKAVSSSSSLRIIAGVAVFVMALFGTAVDWTLLRPGMDAPAEAGREVDASDPSRPTMAVARVPEPYYEPALATAPAPASPSAAATTKAKINVPILAEPTAPYQFGDEQPAPATHSAASHAEIALLLARGDELLAVSDVVSARLFFALGAQENAAAMTAMASTYDPLMLASRNVRGVYPEPREAISWYRRAAAAGDVEAESRLRTLVDVLRQSGQIDASESTALLRVGEEDP